MTTFDTKATMPYACTNIVTACYTSSAWSLQAGPQPGSTALTPIELLLAEEEQTAGKGSLPGSISRDSKGGRQKHGLDHGGAAASLQESFSSLLQSDRFQKKSLMQRLLWVSVQVLSIILWK